MTSLMWLVLILIIALVGAVWWLVTDWRRDIRQATSTGQTAQTVIADMGRHHVPESEERTDPKFVAVLDLLPVDPEPPKRPRSIPVGDLLARAESDGRALRLNWRREDEQRARHDGGAADAGEFPTAVLPLIPDDPS